MKRTIIGLGVMGIIVLAVAAGVFLSITRPVDEASENIQDNTETLSLDETDTGETVIYRIDQTASQVEFHINEVLNGSDFTAVGVTNEVAGDVAVNFSDPAASAVGQIRVNARTLETDDARRNGAISRLILRSDQADYEFITFEPTAITGLPERVAVGDTAALQITGDLTIIDTTQEVTFDAIVTIVSEDQLSGSAETTVTYGDFGISIPNVPFVASVEDTVLLKIIFVANSVQEDLG